MPETSVRKNYRKNMMKKYWENGLKGFLEDEILELLLSLSIKKGETRPIAALLLDKYKELNKIHDAPIEELLKLPGLTMHAAIILKLVRDCSEYYLLKKVKKRNLLKCGVDLINYCRMSMAEMRDESFKTFFLNVQGEVTDIETIHYGTVDQTAIYPRKIIERALFHNAVALIFAHNHPGGNTQPSYSDKELTELLVSAAAIMDIEVYDHLIIGEDDYFSFRDAGLISGHRTFLPVIRMAIHNNDMKMASSLNSRRFIEPRINKRGRGAT